MPGPVRVPAGSPPPRPPTVKPPDAAYLSRFGANNPAANAAIANVRWADDFSWWGFGSLNSVCVCAWLLLVALPLLFFAFVAPSLVYEHHPGLILAAVALFVLTCAFFLVVSCTDPGVAPRPEAIGDSSKRSLPRKPGSAPPTKPPLLYQHPGEEYTYCSDSNRYVRGFDHVCDFVGNDIGEHNMPFFVMFLICLASFSVFLFACCALSGYYLFTVPPPVVHFVHNWWSEAIAVALLLLVFSGLRRCAMAACCQSIIPLIMMMPGANFGVVLLAVLLAAVILVPFVTDMWDQVTPEGNPASFYMLVPFLAFSVLFWGMAVHWLWLVCEGVSQKMWLRAKGWRKTPTDSTEGTAKPPDRTVAAPPKTTAVATGASRSESDAAPSKGRTAAAAPAQTKGAQVREMV